MDYSSDPTETDEEDVEPKQPEASSMIAVGYGRCSTREQANSGLGLEAQRSKVQAFCDMHGMTLSEWLEDAAESSERPLEKRPQGDRLLNMIEERKIDAVIASRLDRLARRQVEALQLAELCRKKRIKLIVLDAGGHLIDFGSQLGRVILTVLGCFAELERDAIRQRTKEALRARRRQKRMPAGHARFGERVMCPKCGVNFKPLPQDRDQCMNCRSALRLEYHPFELATLGIIWELRSNGIPWDQIVGKLYNLGRPSKTKSIWASRVVRRQFARLKANPRLLEAALKALAQERGYDGESPPDPNESYLKGKRPR